MMVVCVGTVTGKEGRRCLEGVSVYRDGARLRQSLGSFLSHDLM